jgi:hypothetical protein
MRRTHRARGAPARRHAIPAPNADSPRERQSQARDTKRELTTALRSEREAMHLGMPLHLGSPGVAGIDPLERYERRALSRRNRAVQRFLEMMENRRVDAIRTERVDGTPALPPGRNLRLIDHEYAIKFRFWQNEPKVSQGDTTCIAILAERT